MSCRICSGRTQKAFSHPVLGKHECSYFYCNDCGFLQTEEPYWLDEAYATAIAAADTGLVQRNIALSKTASAILFFLFDHRDKFLDLAGGYGMLTRLMRDIGFDFYWSDKYCDNILARGFEASSFDTNFSAVTAFEVFEHLTDPVAFVSEAMDRASTRSMLFSTELFEGQPPEPESWWYYMFSTGQHISFYQRRTLRTIASKLGLRCYSRGSFHLLTDKEISASAYFLLSSAKVSRLLSPFISRWLISKTISDHWDLARRS